MAEENSSCVVHLPEELQQEILLRLPCKSLIRFESVCKTWLSMFQSRRFIDLHGQHRQLISDPDFLQAITTGRLLKMFPGLIDPSCSSTQTTRTNTNTEEESWEYVYSVMGPLNGIYCLTAHRHDFISSRDSIMSAKIGLCNPATHAYKATDPFPRKFHSLLSNMSPKHNLHLGFGNVNVQRKKNNSNSLDYRVVVLIEHGDVDKNPSILIFVYSIQRGTWKKIVDYEPGKRNDGKRKATEVFNIQGRRILYISFPLEGCPRRFFEGCNHWMAKVATSEDLTWDVLCFNFADQSLKLIGGPPLYDFTYAITNGEQLYLRPEVIVLHDHLAVINLYNQLLPSNSSGMEPTVEVVVWMMVEYGVEESWTRIYTIKPNFDHEVRHLYGIHYHPLKSGGICIERLLFKDSNIQLIYWNDGDGRGDEGGDGEDGGYEVKIGSANSVCWNTPGISTYVETLERF